VCGAVVVTQEDITPSISGKMNQSDEGDSFVKSEDLVGVLSKV